MGFCCRFVEKTEQVLVAETQAVTIVSWFPATLLLPPLMQGNCCSAAPPHCCEDANDFYVARSSHSVSMSRSAGMCTPCKLPPADALAKAAALQSTPSRIPTPVHAVSSSSSSPERYAGSKIPRPGSMG